MYLTSDKNPSKVKELQKLMREHPDYLIIIRNEPTDDICIDALFNTCSEISNVYIGKIAKLMTHCMNQKVFGYGTILILIEIVPKKKRKKRADGQAPEAPPQPVTCITMHQYATWSKYTGAIGGMIGNYMKYVEGKQSK